MKTNNPFFRSWVGNSIVTSLVLSVILIACAERHRSILLPIERNGMYGFVDEDGNKVVDCKYVFLYSDTIRTIGFAKNSDERIVCIDHTGKELFYVYEFDNGPDYPQEGCFRILNHEGLIGFADTLGNIVIKPAYKFAYPFENGTSKATFSGQLKKSDIENTSDTHSFWESSDWVFIENPLSKKRKEK